MKSIIKSILKEEREKKSLDNAILKDLNKTFNTKTIGSWPQTHFTMDEDKNFGTYSGLERILGNLIVDHLENVYSSYFTITVKQGSPQLSSSSLWGRLP